MASKAQASLAKIISIISTVTAPDSSITTAIARAETRESRRRRGGPAVDIDLNLKVGPEELEEEEGPTVDHSISPAESAAPAGCCSDPTATSEIKSECCDGDDVQEPPDEKKEKKNNISDEKGYLDLLLEAARKLDESSSGERKDDVVVVTPVKRSSPPSDFYEETPPSVRSKRGRNRAMPSRYRDSVLEPWGKPPPVTRLGRAARN